MTDRACQDIVIDAAADECWSVVVDFARYPTWARDVKSVEVVGTDERGQAHEVAYRVAGVGRSARYTLRYDYSQAPDELTWSLVDGDIMRRIDGSYRFEPAPEGGTKVTYELEVDVKVPLPGFVKRGAEHRIITTALRELKREVEQGART